MKVWIAASRDKYEFIEYMADSVVDLAKQIGISPNTIYSAMSHAKARGTHTRFECVDIGDLDE